MRDMRIMGLCSELHMKQSLLDRMQQQLTESKNQYHELSCQQARKASPSASPRHGIIQYEMYERLRQDHDELRNSKKELEDMYAEVKAELGDSESLIKTYQTSHDELGRKYEDALLKIGKINVNPNFSSTILDKLHNEIFDKDEEVDRLLTEVGTQQETIERIGRDTSRRAVGRLNDWRLVIKGATDFPFPRVTSLICTPWPAKNTSR